MIIAALVLAHFDSLHSVEARLHKALGSVSNVSFHSDDSTLVVKYAMETVLTPKASKAAQGMREMAPAEQPMKQGFRIETYEFSHKPSDPPRPMQAVRANPDWIRDYGTWKADAVERQVTGTDSARYYSIEWGNKVDPKLVRKIRVALETGTRPISSNGG